MDVCNRAADAGSVRSAEGNNEEDRQRVPDDGPPIMKILLATVAVVLVAALFYVDAKWRQWIVGRRRDRK